MARTGRIHRFSGTGCEDRLTLKTQSPNVSRANESSQDPSVRFTRSNLESHSRQRANARSCRAQNVGWSASQARKDCTGSSGVRNATPARTGMVKKCANPECLAPFLRLGHGKLFRFVAKISPANSSYGGPTRRTEFFWLCDHCSSTAALKFDSAGTPRVESLPESSTFIPFTYV